MHTFMRLSCGRARSAPSLSIGDRKELSPSAQPTWRVVTAGGSTGNDGTAGPALSASAPLSPTKRRFLLIMHTPAVTETVEPRHRRMAMTTSSTNVPSPPYRRWFDGSRPNSRPSTGHICPTLTEESSFLLIHTPAVAEPVARRHCRLATAMSGPRVPSPPGEW